MTFEPDPADLALSSIPGHETFDPRRHRFSEEELKPQPIMKKARKIQVPEEQKVSTAGCRTRAWPAQPPPPGPLTLRINSQVLLRPGASPPWPWEARGQSVGLGISEDGVIMGHRHSQPCWTPLYRFGPRPLGGAGRLQAAGISC